MSEVQILTGSFVNVASTPKFVPIRGQINEFWVYNLTRSGVTSQGVSGSLTSDRIVEGYFNPDLMTAGTALIKQNGTAGGTGAPISNGTLLVNGCSLFDSSIYSQGATFTILSFVPGATTVFTTSTNHGFKVGDTVRIANMTTAPEMGGLVMTVTATNGTNTFTTLFNSTNSLTSVGQVYRIGNFAVQNNSLYYPQNRAIASITLANPMVVTTLVQQNYFVGDKVRFQIPTVFGMQQITSTTNGLPVEFTVVAANNAVGTQTVTLNVDSTAFTAFAWPAAASYPFSLPIMVPQGEGNTNNLGAFGVVPTPLPYANQDVLSFATQNTGQTGILIGAGSGALAGAATDSIIGSTTDAWMWRAITTTQSFY